MSKKDNGAQLPTMWPNFTVEGKPLGRIELPAYIEAILTDTQRQRLIAQCNNMRAPKEMEAGAKLIIQIPASYFAVRGIFTQKELLTAYRAWLQTHPEETQ